MRGGAGAGAWAGRGECAVRAGDPSQTLRADVVQHLRVRVGGEGGSVTPNLGPRVRVEKQGADPREVSGGPQSGEVGKRGKWGGDVGVMKGNPAA